jgi:hypothetical protein
MSFHFYYHPLFLLWGFYSVILSHQSTWTHGSLAFSLFFFQCSAILSLLTDCWMDVAHGVPLRCLVWRCNTRQALEGDGGQCILSSGGDSGGSDHAQGACRTAEQTHFTP